MKAHAPLETSSTPTLAALGRGEAAQAVDSTDSVHAIGSGAAMNQAAALSMQTIGAGNSFAADLASGGDGDPTGPSGEQAHGGYAAASEGGLGITVFTDRPAEGKHDRTLVGVGETVTFMGSLDGGTWASTGGTGTVDEGGGAYQWEAPSVGDAVTITYTLDGATAKVVMGVIAPVAITASMVGVKNTKQTAGLGGVDMDTKLTFLPTAVNFENLAWKEDPGPAAWKTGYFERFSDQKLVHDPNPNWLQMLEGPKGPTDTAGYFGTSPPFSEGTFGWLVPNRYRVRGDSESHVFGPSLQSMTMAEDGTATVNKYGLSGSRKA